MNYKNIFLILFVFISRSDGWSYVKECAQAFEKFKQYVDRGDITFERYTCCGGIILKNMVPVCKLKKNEDVLWEYIKFKDTLEDEIAIKASLTGLCLGCAFGMRNILYHISIQP